MTALAAAFVLAVPSALSAQTTPARTDPLAVYLDCRSGRDGELIRTEITWVNWVRDRTVADVHVLITSTGAGAGGEQFTIAFVGARSFASRNDTLSYTTNPTTTSDERRRGVLQAITVGLVPYAARTPVGRTLKIAAGAPVKDAAAGAGPANDPWNAWVFSIGLNGSVNGERYYSGRNVNTNFEANRVTERWKTNVEYSFSYNDNKASVQEFDDFGNVTSEETYTNLQRNWNAQWGQVKSLTDHWSTGGEIEFASQTYRNQNLRSQIRGAVEYNIFPYSEFTRRSLKVVYGLSYTNYRYADTTVFNKIRESLPGQFIEINYRTRQPWGSANVNVEHRNLFSDASKRTTELSGNFNVRLFRGLSLNAGGGYNWIHDQVYLPRGEQNAVDVLLRRRALLTGFEYFTHFGISYTFGSIFNNVVNPRF